MFAKIKRITKPIRKKDFYYPSGESIAPTDLFPYYGILEDYGISQLCGIWQFKSIPIRGLMSLVKKDIIVIRQRVEIKAELRKTIRIGKRVSSKSWHLASILEHEITNPQKNESFWNKVETKFKTLELSETEINEARRKIEPHVPRQK